MIAYITIKVDIQCPPEREIPDILDLVGSSCNYYVEYEHGDIKIVSTELVDCSSEFNS